MPSPHRTWIALALCFLIFLPRPAPAAADRELNPAEISASFQSFQTEPAPDGTFTWWLPDKFDALVLPDSAGIVVESSNAAALAWLKAHSPHELMELPAFGIRYGSRTLVVILPWPQYAALEIGDRISVRFSFPAGRLKATPCAVIAQWQDSDPLSVAHAFRHWRQTAADLGSIPRPRPLTNKAKQLPAVERLFGAPHFYLWGPALFSRHDVEKKHWPAAANTLLQGKPDSFPGRLTALMTKPQREALTQLAASSWAEVHLTQEVALALNEALAKPSPLDLPPDLPQTEIIAKNRQALAAVLQTLAHDPATWGDGCSLPMLENLTSAGLGRALLVLSDFYGKSPRPDLAAQAAARGFLLGPYDSYHSIHDPAAAPGQTWETAQFDRAAYETGRVLNADGTGHAGFKGRGYHFAPAAAWPYLQQRVGRSLSPMPASAWFMDCDATGESFDDYDPRHPATRVDDLRLRRARLDWLVTEKKLVLGSEGGSALFADLIHFGHGPQTPYLGHLAPEFKDPASPHFMGKYWPSDSPAYFFKPTPVPPALVTPWFDPKVRIPLYRAALGDEVIPTHHWCFDSFKLSDVAAQRELMELLHMVPPLYHVNRETWPKRKEAIVRHYQFWSPLHRQLAAAPLTRFATLTPDRLVQRTTFQTTTGNVTITVNFGESAWQEFPAKSATASGAVEVTHHVYRIAEADGKADSGKQ